MVDTGARSKQGVTVMVLPWCPFNGGTDSRWPTPTLRSPHSHVSSSVLEDKVGDSYRRETEPRGSCPLWSSLEAVL